MPDALSWEDALKIQLNPGRTPASNPNLPISEQEYQHLSRAAGFRGPPYKELGGPPMTWEDALKIQLAPGRTPDPNPDLPITAREYQLTALAGDRSGPVYKNLARATTIAAPDIVPDPDDIPAWDQMAHAWADVTGDKGVLSVLENKEIYRLTRKNAMKRALEYIRRTPNLSDKGKAEVVKSSFLVELNSASLPTEEEKHSYLDATYELMVNNGVRQLQLDTAPEGEEERKVRHAMALRLRQATPVERRQLVENLMVEYTPMRMGLEGEAIKERDRWDTPTMFGMPDRQKQRMNTLLESFQRLYGYMTKDEAAGHITESAHRMRDRLMLSQLGVDPEINGNLTDRNMVLLDPSKQEGFNLVATFTAPEVMDELLGGRITNPTVAEFMEKTNYELPWNLSKAYLQATLVERDFGDARAAERIQEGFSATHRGTQDWLTKAMLDVSGVVQDGVGAFVRSTEEAGRGQLQRKVVEWIGSQREQDAVLLADAEGFLDLARMVSRHMFTGRETDISVRQALKDSGHLPYMFAQDRVQHEASMKSIVEDGIANHKNLNRLQKVSDRFNKALKGNPIEGYDMLQGISDGGYILKSMFLNAGAQLLGELSENPQNVLLLAGGEFVESIPSQWISRFCSNAVRMRRIRNAIKELGPLGGPLARRTQEALQILRMGADLGVTDLSPRKLKLLDSLEAHADVLLQEARGVTDDVTAKAYLRRPTASMNRFAKSMAGLWDQLEQADPTLTTMLEKFIDTKREGLLNQARNWWPRLKGKMAPYATERLNAMGALLTNDELGQVPGKVLNRPIPGDTLVRARAEAAEAIANGEIPDKVRDMMDRVIDKSGDIQHIPGAAASWEKLSRLAEIDDLRKTGQAVAGLDEEFRRLVTDLSGEPLVDQVDQATFLVLDNMEQLGRSGALNAFGDLVHKYSGGKLFPDRGSLQKVQTTARRILDATTVDTAEFLGQQMMNNVRKRRLDQVYRLADAKLRARIRRHEIEAEVDPDALGVENQTAIRNINRERQALVREMRDALAADVRQRYDFNSTLLSKYVDGEDVNELIKQHPTVWGEVSTAVPEGTILPETQRELDWLSKHKAKAKAQAEALNTVLAQKLGSADLADLGETHPLLTGTFAEEMYRAEGMGELFQRLVAKREVVATLAERMAHWTTRPKDIPISKEALPTKGMAKDFMDQLAADPNLDFSVDDAVYMKHILDSMPPQFWDRGLTFQRVADLAEEAGKKEITLGWFDAMDNTVTAVGNAGANPLTMLHEIGHYILSSVVDDNMLRRLAAEWELASNLSRPDAMRFRAFVQAITNPDPRKATKATRTLFKAWGTRQLREFRPYLDNFTEWFARAFSRALRQTTADDPKLTGRLKEIAQAIGKQIDELDRAEPINSTVVEALQRFMRGQFEPRGRTTRKIRARQDISRNHVEHLAGVRRRMVAALEKESQFRMTPEMKLVFYGPLGLDAGEMDELAASVFRFHRKLDDVISSTEAKAGYAATKFEWNPWDEMRKADVNAERAVMRNDKAVRKQWDDQMKRLTNWKLDDGVRHAYDEIEDLANMFQAQRAAEAGVDLLTLNAMPFWDQVRMVRQLAKDTETMIAVEADRMERLARVVNNLSVPQRRLIQKAMELGEPDLEKLAQRVPQIGRYVTRVRAKGGDVLIDNVQKFLTEESAMQARLLETAHAKGFITDDVYQSMRKAGYSPHMYGMHERPKLVQTARMERVKKHVGQEGVKAVEGDTTAGIDGGEMMFARDLAQWRVRVEAGDGKLFDELFPSQEEAMDYIQKNWGDDAVAGLTADGPNFGFRTSLGNKGLMARPIGDDANILDLLTGNVTKVEGPGGPYRVTQKLAPEARLARYAQLNRDMHTHSFLESLRASGLVISREQADQFGLMRTNKKGMAKWAEYWRPIPNDPSRFGNLADHFVHARLLTEMNNMHGTYEGLQSVFKAVQEAWSHMGYGDASNTFMKWLGGVANVDTKLGKAVKFTQVVLNSGAVLANVVSNFMFSSLAIGPQILNPRNAPIMWRTFTDIFGPGLRGRLSFGLKKAARKTALVMPDDAYYEAVRNGIVGSSIFSRSSNPYLREAFVRLNKLMNPARMEARYSKLQKLYKGVMDRGNSGAKLANIKLEIAALEGAMSHAARGNLRKFAEWALSTIGLMEKNALGLPSSRVSHILREFYGKIDDYFKVATYRIARQTMPEHKAAWVVKAFMQDYANVNPIVGQLSRTPLIGGLMPSFSYEMARITKNAIRYRPLRFMAVAGAAQAFNSFSAFAAGVSEERVRAIEDAMGSPDPLERMIKRSTSLRFYDYRTGNLAWSVDFGDLLLPLFNFAQGYNGLGRMAEGMSDPRSRNMWDSALVAAAKFTGNFIGARPMTNAALAGMYNQDPVTGQPIWDQEAQQRTKWDFTRGWYHLIGKMVIPPQFPGGRHFNDIVNSSSAVLDPRTERPYKQSSLGRNIVRALTNLKGRGGPFATLSALLGGEDRAVGVDDRDIIQNLMYQAISAEGTSGMNATPMFGLDRDRSELWARTMNEADPAARERLRNQLKAMYRDEDAEMIVAGRRYPNNKTRYQEDRWAADRDRMASLVEQFDNLQIPEQTRVLIGMDLAEVNGKTIAEYIEVMSTSDEPKYRWETAQDIGVLRQAQLEVQNYLRERPAKADRFRRLLDFLRFAEGRALRVQQGEQIKEIERLRKAGL